MQVTDEPIVMDLTFNAPRNIVWSAITEKDQMVKWFFEDIDRFEAEVGSQTAFDVQVEETVYPHRWTVTEVVPGERIVYDWKYEGIPGHGIVEWNLADSDRGTKLHFVTRVVESFPTDDGNFNREAGVAGWNYFLADRLTEYLNSSGS